MAAETVFRPGVDEGLGVKHECTLWIARSQRGDFIFKSGIGVGEEGDGGGAEGFEDVLFHVLFEGLFGYAFD